MALRQARRSDYDYDYNYDQDYSVPNEVPEQQEPRLKAVNNTVDKPVSVLNTRLRSRAQILFVAFAVLAMAVTVRSGISASRGYALVAVQTQAQNLEQENERLRVEIARLKAPGRIRSIAESELNMKTPTKMYFAHEK